MMASRSVVRSARVLKAPVRTPIRANARQIRLQSTLPSPQTKQAAANGGGGFMGGIAGGALVFALGYGYYHFSGAKSIVDGAAITRKKFNSITASMKEQAPEPNELLKWFRNTVTSYAGFIPGVKSHVDSAFNDLDAIEQKHRGEVDKIVGKAYADMREATKGGLSMETAQKSWGILHKYLGQLTELAGDASSEILDNHPDLKDKVGGNIDQLKQMANSYGPEAKKEMDKVYAQIKDIIASGVGADTAAKISKVVQEKTEKLKAMGDELWTKGMAEAKPYLDKSPEIKAAVEENADALKSGNFAELLEKIKGGDVGDLKAYVKRAAEKAKGSTVAKSVQEYIKMIPGGQEIVPKLQRLHEVATKRGGEAEKILKDTYKEIGAILSKKADEVEGLAEDAKEDVQKDEKKGGAK